MQHNPICPYCNKLSELVKGDVVYSHRPDLYNKSFYICHSCDAYVGCHPNSTRPLGRLANKRLRALKSVAHVSFDPFWKEHLMHRREAYAKLAQEMNIPIESCHIGMFNEEQCEEVARICRNWKTKIRL